MLQIKIKLIWYSSFWSIINEEHTYIISILNKKNIPIDKLNYDF